MSNGISAHGTLVKLNGTAIGELRDVTLPPRTRKVIDTSTHNDDDDSCVVGFRRSGEASFLINFLPADDPTHDPATGLIYAYENGTKDRYDIERPDGSTQLFSGYVTNISPKAPVEGEQAANVSLKASGRILEF